MANVGFVGGSSGDNVPGDRPGLPRPGLQLDVCRFPWRYSPGCRLHHAGRVPCILPVLGRRALAQKNRWFVCGLPAPRRAAAWSRGRLATRVTVALRVYSAIHNNCEVANRDDRDPALEKERHRPG